MLNVYNSGRLLINDLVIVLVAVRFFSIEVLQASIIFRRQTRIGLVKYYPICINLLHIIIDFTIVGRKPNMPYLNDMRAALRRADAKKIIHNYFGEVK